MTKYIQDTTNDRTHLISLFVWVWELNLGLADKQTGSLTAIPTGASRRACCWFETAVVRRGVLNLGAGLKEPEPIQVLSTPQLNKGTKTGNLKTGVVAM